MIKVGDVVRIGYVPGSCVDISLDQQLQNLLSLNRKWTIIGTLSPKIPAELLQIQSYIDQMFSLLFSGEDFVSLSNFIGPNWWPARYFKLFDTKFSLDKIDC